ncbi:MAG: DNA replication/repair protein RecF, partial [Gammaproteobacteria bacterium]
MWLQDLQITNFRNLASFHLQPGPGLNVIAGPNASGKTALLESIYLLSRSRSFRSHRINELIAYPEKQLRLVAGWQMAGGRPLSVCLERNRNQTRLTLAGQPVRNLSAHARQLPILLLTPESHELLAGRPQLRRRWLDWAMFHVEQNYLATWQDCFAALRQRNALLKRGAKPTELDAWELTLVNQTMLLEQLRRDFLADFSRQFADLSALLLPGRAEIGYVSGRPEETGYLDYLRENRPDDRQRGFTQAGAHRSDLQFKLDDLDARAYLSRGQAKLYIAALVLALGRVMVAAGLRPVFLVDDLPAELDPAARECFMARLAETGAQVFVTTIEASALPVTAWADCRLFHVEHGRLAEVI